MKKHILPLFLLLAGSGISFAAGSADFSEQILAFGAPGAVSPAAEVIPGPVPDISFAMDDQVLRLREEAAADPDKFIDEHTPEEVGLAFDLFPSRFPIVDPKRIQDAALRITVDLSAQRLLVQSSGTAREFKISSGLPPGHPTPGSGKCYAPDSLEAMHYSSLYNNAPMPNAVFFNGNIAIHATESTGMLGKPASHGCIRLSLADSKVVFGLVRANGRANTSICVKGSAPAHS